MKPASYDLRHEPWIPVRDASGNIAPLGLIELLRCAHEYQSLALSNPLDTVSLYRVLIVLSHCILGDPETIEDWIKAFDRGRFLESDVTDYFERYSDRFDIFHPDYPFMQTAGLVQQDSSGRPAPAMAGSLLAEVASGNNKTLFSHDIDDAPRALTEQEATLALIRAQYFALGGIAKKYSNLFPYQSNFLQAPLV
ncbi:MAG: type I-E CRISPR-associated protein Cse1/CasA, partial [Alkalispirochaeta sp.]